MSSFNPLSNAKIPMHRSSFDVTGKSLFTCKVGELIPCGWTLCIPDETYKVSSDWFTRTVPVNTAAYTRLKEYYDVFAVPLRLIHRMLPQSFTQMEDYSTHAASFNKNAAVLKSVPYTTLSEISRFFMQMKDSNLQDDAGLPIVPQMIKFLNLIKMGSFLDPSEDKTVIQKITGMFMKSLSSVEPVNNPFCFGKSFAVNLLAAATYQKIYYDFFSDSQWERHLAYSYNFDWWDDSMGAINSTQLSANMFTLRYANYPKDMFLGVLPNSQYGDVAVLPSLTDRLSPTSVVLTEKGQVTEDANRPFGQIENPLSTPNSVFPTDNDFHSTRYARLNTTLDALSVRALEYFQRWKEVVQFGSKDYSDQMYRQFGIKAPEYMGNHCHYVGGWSNVLNISEVVNNNLADADSQAVIAGKGVSSQSGHTLTYKTGGEHCVLMCIYHAVPLVDYDLTGQDPQLLLTEISDFPQPAFDQLGMQPVPFVTFTNDKLVKLSVSDTPNMGFNLRYWQFKTNVDRVFGGFMKQGPYKAWAAPLSAYDLLMASTPYFSYRTFKVRPQQLNSIFSPQISFTNASVDFDQLLCNVNLQMYKVSNLDRNGLPY